MFRDDAARTAGHPGVSSPAAPGIAALMLGAVFMHVKIRDPIERALPAASMFALSPLVALA